MEDYREIGPPGNGETRKTGTSNLAAVRETTRHVRIHASRVIFRGALDIAEYSHPFRIGRPGYDRSPRKADNQTELSLLGILRI